MNRSRVAPGLAVSLLLAFALSGCEPDPPPPAPAALGVPGQAIITMEKGGEIHIRFFADKAPGHVANFKKLAHEGYYDGTTFHRVIPEFMIQGGDGLSKDDDPLNDGTGTPGYSIPAEFNDIPHRRSIVAMARRSDPGSAGSQFYIMVADSPRWRDVLDGKFTVFGEVTQGMKVVDRIVDVPRDLRDRPTEDQVIASIAIEPLPKAGEK